MQFSKLFFLVALQFVTFTSTHAQPSSDSLRGKLEHIQGLGYLPGFSVAVVDSSGVIFLDGFGFRDIESKSPFEASTLLNIGSISKTMTGIAIMQLVEDGNLCLDDEINRFLPFNLYNPHHPDKPILVRHIATHTSTLIDPDEYERTYLFVDSILTPKKNFPRDFRKWVDTYNSNEEMPVIDFIENMCHPLGEWYSKKNYSKKEPGEEYHYSNISAVIAGHIVAEVSGEPYKDYVVNHILRPLHMVDSGWDLADIDINRFITHYLSNDLAIPRYELVSYADGGLITSAEELAKYLSAMIKAYQGGTCPILNSQSAKFMMDPIFTSEEKNYGVFWSINGKGEYGHSGGDPGIMTYMMFDPDTGIGRIVMTNKFDDTGNGINQVVYIWKTLEEFINRL